MSTAATHSTTYTRAQTINFVTDEIWNKLRVIVRDSGLDAATFVDKHDKYTNAIRTWLTSGHLTKVYIEIYNKHTDGLVRRWDVNVFQDSSGYTQLWADTEGIRYALAKIGLAPENCSYDIRIKCKPGWPDLDGWNRNGHERATNHLTRNSVGTTATANGFALKMDFYK